jgi:flagella basal body P-ring formation protein FlgA
VAGGRSPWVGDQRFEVTVTLPGQAPARFGVDAQIALPPAVVVASRSLPRGAVLSAVDVELRLDARFSDDQQTFASIDEVLGTETTRAIGVGMVLDRDAIRSPLLVRRSEVITVTAVAGGIRVTTNARAAADGSLGDLIPVESLHDRAKYFARVSSLRQAEVYAGAVKTRHADATPVAQTKQGTLR